MVEAQQPQFTIPAKQMVTVSKLMSYILRHGAEAAGIQVRPDGYIYLLDMLNQQKFKKQRVTEQIVRYVVENNDKKRFELKEEEGVLLIRAAQGHTITAVKTEELLQKITNPFVYNQIIHGTYYTPLPLILQGGLNRMARNHMHLAIGLPGNGVISGMRTSCQVVVDINMTRAMHGPHKMPFFISTNKVVLSEGLEDGSLPAAYFRYVLDFQKQKFIHQTPFDYICVFDFECTCTEDSENFPINSQEIIEFPVVIVDVKTKAIKSVFQTYVKPTLDPQLTPFCTELTGITQEQVDGGVSIQDALKQVHVWLGEQGMYSSEFIFMSCGDFDGNTLGREAKAKSFFVPNYLKRWINLKKAFPAHQFNTQKQPLDWTTPETIKNCNSQVRGMTDMLEKCELALEGRHHSGLDDSKNLARVAIKLLDQGFEFTQAMVHQTK